MAGRDAQTPAHTTPGSRQEGPGCLITIIWFVLVGWWLSSLWVAVAWLLIVLVVTMPIGLVMLNNTPLIANLRPPTREFQAATQGTAVRIQEVGREQYPFLVRALYFVLIGWWLSAIWVILAHFASLTLILLPAGILMYDRVPVITTLKRY